MSTTQPPDKKPADKPRPSGSPFGKFMMSPVLATVLLGLTVSAVALAAAGVFVIGGSNKPSDGEHAAAPPPSTTGSSTTGSSTTGSSAPDDGPSQPQGPPRSEPPNAGPTTPGTSTTEPSNTQSTAPESTTPGSASEQRRAHEDCTESRGPTVCSRLFNEAEAELYLTCRDEFVVDPCLRLASDPSAVDEFRSCRARGLSREACFAGVAPTH
jgi:hypothetical protein